MGKLTALRVAKAEPGLHADGDGLYLQVGASGARSWIYRYVVAGRQRYLGLGSVAAVRTYSRSRVDATASAFRCAHA